MYIHAGNKWIRITKCESLAAIWGNYESLWPADLQYFGPLQICLSRLQITFVDGFAKRPYLEKFYAVRSNSANKLQITDNQFKK